jgi:hypothetical protein
MTFKFAKVVRGISQKGYDVGKLIEEFSDLESARSNCWDHKASITDLEIKCNDLNQEYSVLKKSVDFCKHRLCLYDQLEAAGFGLKELKLLANIIPEDQAQQKFYKDVEEQYDDKLGFELQLNKLRSEIATVSTNLSFSRMALLAQPLVSPSLQRLFSKGVAEQDIVELANLLFERSRGHGIDSGSTMIDEQSLMDRLQNMAA